MPLYLIDIENDSAQGPFESKEDLAAVFDDESDDTFIVFEIDENGFPTVLGDAAEYLEADEQVEAAT